MELFSNNFQQSLHSMATENFLTRGLNIRPSRAGIDRQRDIHAVK